MEKRERKRKSDKIYKPALVLCWQKKCDIMAKKDSGRLGQDEN
jgi:hypothetical protein